MVEAENERYLNIRALADRWCCSITTIERYLREREDGFPQPIRIGRQRLWRVSEISDYEKRCARVG